MKHANPYAGLVGSPAPAEPEDPSDAVEERGPRDETGFGALAEAAEMSRPSPPRPRCGAPPARRGGLGPSGVRRRRRPEAMGPASNPCSRPKRHLRRFAGMDPENLQSYLNPYVCFFRVERDDERRPKIARAVRHLLMAEARFRR